MCVKKEHVKGLGKIESIQIFRRTLCMRLSNWTEEKNHHMLQYMCPLLLHICPVPHGCADVFNSDIVHDHRTCAQVIITSREAQ